MTKRWYGKFFGLIAGWLLLRHPAGGLLGLKSARTDAENAALKTIVGALDMRNATQWRAALRS